MNNPRMPLLAAVFHTLVIGTYPVVHQYVVNHSIAPLSALWIPLALALGGTIALIFAARTISASLTSGGIVVSWLCVGLMPLLAVRSAVAGVLPSAAGPSGQLTVVAVYVTVIGITIVWMTRLMSEAALRATREAMNAMAVVLLVLNLAGVMAQRPSVPWQPTVEALVAPVRADTPNRRAVDGPDIYYIILDGYARDDVLVERYGVSHNSLTEHLRHTGFYVAQASQANYVQTYLSLASTLNMVYLDPLAQAMPAITDRRPLSHLIENNVVVSGLKTLGYTTVLLSSDYYATSDMAQIDLCLCEVFRPTDFETQWLAQTPLGAIPSVMDAAYTAHRNKVMRTFELLQEPLSGRRTAFRLCASDRSAPAVRVWPERRTDTTAPPLQVWRRQPLRGPTGGVRRGLPRPVVFCQRSPACRDRHDHGKIKG